MALACLASGLLHIWNLRTGELERTLKWDTLHVDDMAASADGRLVVMASTDGTLRVMDASLPASATPLPTPERHSGSVSSVAFTADGQFAVSGSGDRTLKVWPVADALAHETVIERAVRTLEGHSQPVVALALPADKRMVISADSYDLKEWNFDTGEPLRTVMLRRSHVYDIAVTADGAVVMTGLYQGTLEVWDLASDRPRRKLVGLHEGPQGWEPVLPKIEGVAITPDGRIALTASADRAIQVWDIAAARSDPGREKIEPSRTLTGHRDEVWAVAVTEDGRLAVSGSKDTTLKVWNLSTTGVAPNSEQAMLTLEGHTKWVTDVAITPDGRLAVSASTDCTLRVWDLEQGTTLAIFTAEGPLACCAISPDGILIAAGERYGRLHILRLQGRHS